MWGLQSDRAALPVVEQLEQRVLMAATPGVDLAAGFAGRLPNALAVAAENKITVRETNLGRSTAAGTVTVDLFASTDTALDSGDDLLGTAQQAIKLGRGRAANFAVNFPTPTGLTDGQYFLIADVKNTSVPGGTDDVVVSANTLTIDRPFSDVSIKFAGLPNWPIEIDGRTSGRSTAAVAVVNSGDVPVKTGFTISYYLSSDSTLTSAAPLLSQTTVAPVSLKPGQGKGVSLRLAVPPGTVVGGYFLFAVVKPTAAGVDSVTDNDVAFSNRRVAVVTRIPVTPVYENNVTLYYTGPDYYYVDDGYGYYDTNATSAPAGFGGSDAPASGTTSQPGDGTGDGSTTRPTTQPSDPAPSGDPNDGNPVDQSGPPADDTTMQPVPNGDDSDGGSSDSSDSGGGDDSDDGGDDDSGCAITVKQAPPKTSPTEAIRAATGIQLPKGTSLPLVESPAGISAAAQS